MLPLCNATLTAVVASGSSADYDQPAGAGTGKWSGRVPAFWSEVNERVQAELRSELELRRYLIIDDTLPVDWQIGDVVTVEYRGSARSATVDDVQITSPGLFGGVVRLTMQDV